MPWQLEIHHLDVQVTGDATLIIVRETGVAHGMAPVVRSVLVDGGRSTRYVQLNNYVANELEDEPLNAIVLTHYQDDHIGGLTRILNLADERYANVRIYDQGWPGDDAALEQAYINYIRAINGLGPNGREIQDYDTYCANRVRVSFRVRADNAAPDTNHLTDIGLPAAPADLTTITQAASWLLTGGAADILWSGFAGSGAYVANVAPAGAPTMSLIAANKYVRVHAGGVTARIDGTGADVNNEKSLGAVVTFGNFRYYVAGDIETAQEDEIQQYLNNADDVPGRVLAVKTSHHGSNTATSRAFIDRLRPLAAFISCGTGNIHNHPARETTNTLDGFPANPTGAVPAPAHGAGIPLNRPIRHYLTGYQVAATLQSRAGTGGVCAGNPLAHRRGDIRILVDAAQALRDQRGGGYLGVAAAAIAAATDPAVAGPLDLATAQLAAAGAASVAVTSGAAAAAREFLTIAGPGPSAAADATAQVITNAINLNSGAAATAIYAANAARLNGAAAGPAAGAGAVAATYIGGCGLPAISAAVTWSLTTVGVDLATAQAAGNAAALQGANPAGLFSVRYWNRATGANQTETFY